MEPILTVSTSQIDKSSYNLRMLSWGVVSAIVLLILLRSSEVWFIVGVGVAVFTPMVFSSLFEGGLRSAAEIAFYLDGISINGERFGYNGLRKMKVLKAGKGNLIYTHFWAKDDSEHRWVFYNLDINHENLQQIFAKQVRAYNEAVPAADKINYI